MIEIYSNVIRGEDVYIKRYLDENNKLIYEKKIKITKVTMENNKYILLYDSNMNVIRDVHRYLNVDDKVKNYSINTRNAICTGLKVLYSFLEIFDYDIRKLGKKEMSMLKQFILGVGEKGVNYSFKGLPNRSKITFNKYMSYYRGYFKFLDIDNKIINDREVKYTEKAGNGLLGHLGKNQYEKYTINEDIPKKSKTVPKYIKRNEFEKIIELIKLKYSYREEIIVRLMYENGMRIGEVLGLTLEDIDYDSKKLYLRDRITDDEYQHAKGCYTPKSRSEYKSKEYNTLDYGYEIVKPSKSVIRKLEKYIDNEHGDMSDKKRVNYFNGAKADEVEDDDYLEQGNFYVFLNKNGSKLNISGWNKILRGIYKEVGIKVDKDKRENNLNHRFRHGFAMRRIKEDKVDIYQLAQDLRHKGLSSLMCYFNPEEEDIYRVNESIAEDVVENVLGDLDIELGDDMYG